MSSFKSEFINEKGEMFEVFCYDDYFGQHQYGYAFPNGEVLTVEEMNAWGFRRYVNGGILR